MMWSAQQRGMLSAMGYTLYLRPGARLDVTKEPLENTARPAMPSTDSVLLQAILKAAHGRDIEPLQIDIDALRTSPQAKRALWPQLRRLMKT